MSKLFEYQVAKQSGKDAGGQPKVSLYVLGEQVRS